MGQRQYKLVVYGAISCEMYASNYFVQITQKQIKQSEFANQNNNVKRKERKGNKIKSNQSNKSNIN